MGASPWERLLGLAHGQQVSTPQGQFLAFDHLSPASADQLNRHLFVGEGQPMEIVSVGGFGLWKFGLLFTLTYLLCLKLTRSLVLFQFKSAFSSLLKPRQLVDEKYFLLSSLLLGLGAEIVGVGNVGPVLFAIAFLATLIAATRSKPVVEKVVRNLEYLELSRLFWAGWLLPQTLAVSSQELYPQFFTNLVGLGLGSAAAFLVGAWSPSGGTRQFKMKSVQRFGERAFSFGCWEVLGVTLVIGLSILSGVPHFLGSIFVIGAFGWGRLSHSALLRLILFMPEVGEGRRKDSLFRILAGVWFLLPLVLGPFLRGYDQTALMIWLGGLVPFAVQARPWGSTAATEPLSGLSEPVLGPVGPILEPACSETLRALSPSQKAAILFMSLPPEMSAQLFSELGPEEVQAITLAITQLPSTSPGTRASVLQEFLCSSGGPGLKRDVGTSTTEQLESLVKEKPSGTAGLIRSVYGLSKRETKPQKPKESRSSRRRRRKKKHVCKECGETFNHGIGLRKHQRQTSHKGIEVVELYQ